MDNYTPPTAETIAYVHAHSPWNAFVLMVVMEGHAPSVWPVQVIETVGNTLIYTTDGMWYSVATRTGTVDWWTVEADYTADEAHAYLAGRGMGERLTDGETTVPLTTDPETGSVVPEALAYDEYPASIRAQIDAWEDEAAGTPLPHTMGWYSPEGEPVSPHYGTPFGHPTSHPKSALTASMTPMTPVSAARDSANPVIDRASYDVSDVLVEWLSDPVITGARFDPASGYAVARAPRPQYARQGR